MAGMSRSTGKTLGGFDHLRQSISDILSTPIGTRVHRREYGSRIPRLVDRPINPSTVADLVAAAAEALDRWEPRLRLEQIQVESVSDGHITMNLSGWYLRNGQRVQIEGLLI